MRVSTRSRIALGVLLTAGAVAALATGAPAAAAPPPDRARSVIYFIGDGFGPNQVTLARHYARNRLALDAMPITGKVSTHSLTGPVTDSAAAGTALASGVKTHNGFVGVDGERGKAPTVMEAAKAAGFAVGVVSSARVTHATPACFYAHIPNRGAEAPIADMLIDSDLAVALGGGKRNFSPERLERAREKGWRIVSDRRAMLAEAAKPGRLLGLFNGSHMKYGLDRSTGADETEPTLAEMTCAAIDVLGRDGKRFFLMVEGGRIDHAAHVHDASAMCREVVDFDAAIAAARARAKAAGDWLIVVTADHATGGLAISEKLDVEGMHRVRASAEAVLDAVSKGHAGDLPTQRQVLRKLARDRMNAALTDEQIEAILKEKDEYASSNRLANIVSSALGCHWFTVEQTRTQMTHGHDGVDVPVWASGPGSAAFSGSYDNTEVPGRIAAALGVSFGAGTAVSEPPRRDPAPEKKPARQPY